MWKPREPTDHHRQAGSDLYNKVQEHIFCIYDMAGLIDTVPDEDILSAATQLNLLFYNLIVKTVSPVESIIYLISV